MSVSIKILRKMDRMNGHFEKGMKRSKSVSRPDFKYRAHALGRTFTLYHNAHFKQLVDVEEEFLHAAEFGDIPTVRRLLGDNPDLNVDCIDALGRTALRLAVKNEHLEVSQELY